MLRAVFARILIVTVSSTIIPTAEGAVIATEAALNADRAHILMLLDRPDVAAQLEAYGVRMSDAKVRIAALTDEEAARLSSEIDTALAGAGGGGGIIAVITVGVMAAVVVLLLPFFLVGGLIAIAVKQGRTPHAASQSTAASNTEAVAP